MNPNENHVSPLARKIDQLIETNHPTGIPAADDLAATIPQARRDFQQQLEDRLTAQIQFASHGDEKLTSITSTISKPLRPRAYLPLTLAAAMLAVVMVGSFLLLRGGKMPDANLVLLIDQTSTPTPEPTAIRMVNVLVARQDLPRGYNFPSTAAELANVAGYVPWPESAVPFNALLEDQNGLESLEGKILRTDVYREQPLMSNLLVNDLTQIASVGSDAIAILPADRLVIVLPLNLIDNVSGSDLQVGMQVDISALVAFVRASNSYSDITMQKLVRNAIVLHLGDFSTTTTTSAPDIITISASREEVETLALLVNSEIPMTLDVSTARRTTPAPNPTTAAQKVAVTIPTDQIVSVPIGSGIQAGDHVSVTAKFILVNASDELFPAVPTEAPVTLASPTIGGTITLLPSNNNARTFMQKVISDAPVADVNAQANTITIEVSEQEATIMKWLIDAQMPITLEKLTTNQGTIPTVITPEVAAADTTNPSGFQPGLIPPGKRGVEIDRDLITSDLTSFKAEDTVDIAISFLTINSNPSFANDPNVSNTTVPANAYVATKSVFTGVKILVMGGIHNQADTQFISLALDPRDADLLTWVLASHLPIALSIAHSDANSLTVENLPDGRVSVEMNIMSNQSIFQGLNTANILAQINFTNYDPNNPESLLPKTLVSQIIVQDSEMTPISTTPNNGNMRVKLIISQDELPALAWVLKANIPFTLQVLQK